MPTDEPSPRPCIECGTHTTGSTGAAGIRWPSLCQACKDKADHALGAQCRMIAVASRYGAESAARVLGGQDKKADAQLEAAVFGLGPSAGFDAASRCIEDTEPFDDGTGPMEPMDPREYNPDLDPNFGTDADIATRVREYGKGG